MSIQRLVPRCIIKALFVIAYSCKQPKCPPTGEGTRKLCHVHTVEHPSVPVRGEPPMRAPTRVTRSDRAGGRTPHRNKAGHALSFTYVKF